MSQLSAQKNHKRALLIVQSTVVASCVTIAMVFSAATANAETAVGLGSTSNFAVLAGQGITNTGATTVSGNAGSDMGSSPLGTFTGSAQVTNNDGTNYTAVASAVTAAKASLVTAYNDAAGRTSTATYSTLGGGQTLVSGVYTSASSMLLNGNLILDGQGDPNAVFIFQMGSTLTTASASSVSFIGGAQACNVFWQVGSSATFGTTTDFSGHVFAYQSITANTGATFHGQLLAREAAVTLDHNTITNDVCAGSPTHSPTPSASASSSATSTPSATATPTPVASTETGGKLPHTETSAFPLQVLGFGVVGLGLVGLVAR